MNDLGVAEIPVVSEEIKESEETTFEMTERRALYIFYKSSKNARQLTKFGDMVFNSPKHNYSCLYVDKAAVEKTVAKLKEQPFVQEVRVGALQDLAPDFSLAFLETNEALKKSLD
jgi:uncharacterized protein YlbG (UPF0298 family)